MNKRDNLFSNPIPQLNDWVFDEAVADVFNDMLHRSIPGYANIIAAVARLVTRFAQPNSQLYDLGCSLGNATLVMRRAVEGKQCNIIAIDNSAPMLARCKRNLASYKSDTPVTLIEGNIQDLTIERASVVVSNFTLQFLPPDERQAVINKIYQGLQPNGIFILSEKFTLTDPRINTALFDLHYDFKRTNGYSELELGQKRTMLENVMLTDSIDTHKQRLQQAGFKHIDTWFQCFNFGSLLAIKEQ